MGAAFGLLSLLITVCIILWMMVGTGYVGTVAKQNQVVRQQVNKMGGKDAAGTVDAIRTIDTRVDRTGGRPKLLVTRVTPAGAMEEQYGLRPGDRILEIGGLDFETNIGGSRDAAHEWIATAYAREQPIVVQRGNERLTLPTPQHLKAVAARDREAEVLAAQSSVDANKPAPQPAAPPKEEEMTSLQKALDTIRTTPGK